MRKHYEPYQIGKNITDAAVARDEIELIDLTHFDKMQHGPGNRQHGFSVGTMDKVREGEEAGSIADEGEEETRNAAMEEFANKIKKAVSAKLMGRKLNLKLKGHPELVKQVANMIKFETEYLNSLISGQAADTPALQKNKAIIDSEAKKLDRMLQTSDFWPFK